MIVDSWENHWCGAGTGSERGGQQRQRAIRHQVLLFNRCGFLCVQQTVGIVLRVLKSNVSCTSYIVYLQLLWVHARGRFMHVVTARTGGGAHLGAYNLA